MNEIIIDNEKKLKCENCNCITINNPETVKKCEMCGAKNQNYQKDNNEKIKCEVCDCYYTKTNKSHHKNTFKHKLRNKLNELNLKLLEKNKN